MQHVLAAAAAAIMCAGVASAEPIHHHARKSYAVDLFYSTWMKPDRPSEFCCSKTDCDEAEVRIIDGKIWAKRKRDILFRLVPAGKIEQGRDSPDGMSHLCAPNWNAHEVYCFVPGIGG